jgi:hypothetical protein
MDDGDAVGRVRMGVASVGAPCVAQRVWPMPIVPASGSSLSTRARLPSLPSARRRSMRPLPACDAGGIVAAIFEPLQRLEQQRGRLGPLPMMPMMPHISGTSPSPRPSLVGARDGEASAGTSW